MAAEKSYKSPTTPSLMVTFINYVIELVCLNLNNRLGPRFWRDTKYWGPKYRREIKGMHNLKEIFEDFDDPILRTAIINSVRQLNLQSLSAKKTIGRLVKAVRAERVSMVQHRKQLASQAQPQIHDVTEHSKRNAGFVDIRKQTRLTKLKEIENRDKSKT